MQTFLYYPYFCKYLVSHYVVKSTVKNILNEKLQ